MRPHRHLLVAAVLIGLGMVPQTGVAQGTGTSAARGLYLTTDPTRMTCLLPEDSKTGEATGRCYAMECAPGGDRCTCPLKLPNGWKQPLSGEQCQQLGQLLPPLPPVEPAKAAEKEKPKAPGPATQVEQGKDKDEDRKIYTVRLQAQGNGVEESVVLVWPTPIPVAAGIKGLEILKGKLSRKELLVRTDPFRRAERFIRNGPAGGGIAKGQSFELFERSPIRVDVEIIRGINFRE
jgi:hypothetical protein